MMGEADKLVGEEAGVKDIGLEIKISEEKLNQRYQELKRFVKEKKFLFVAHEAIYILMLETEIRTLKDTFDIQ
jgi:hypothetical protein